MIVYGLHAVTGSPLDGDGSSAPYSIGPGYRLRGPGPDVRTGSTAAKPRAERAQTGRRARDVGDLNLCGGAWLSRWPGLTVTIRLLDAHDRQAQRSRGLSEYTIIQADKDRCRRQRKNLNHRVQVAAVRPRPAMTCLGHPWTQVTTAYASIHVPYA